MGASPGTNMDAESLEPLIPRIRVTRRERNRLILVLLAALVVLWLFFQSWDALGPFVFALVLAYLMLPLVNLLDRFLPRVVAILVVYLAFIGLVWGIIAWLTPLVTNQIEDLAGRLPAYQQQVQSWSRDFIGWYNSLPISEDVRQSIENTLRSMVGAIGSALQNGTVGALGLVTRAMGFVIGLVIIPFWLFYVLKDKDRGITAFNNMLPPAWRNDVWRIVRIINGILSSYIRGQLLLGVVVGMATFIGMLVVGAPYPLLLGTISGLTEVVPIVGPVLGAIPGLGVAAFSSQGWILIVQVLLVYIVVQQLENNLLVPKIQGDSVKLHPAIIMVSLVVGSQVGGLLGLIAAVPVAAILRDVYLYLYRRLTEGYSPTAAEASVPSEQGEESPQARTREERELAEEAKMPGINSEDELISALDEADQPADKIADKTVPDR
jgi:predicted PurR-regulated permease PerM